jgi:hypothetical protein
MRPILVASRFSAHESKHSDRREWTFSEAIVTEVRFDAAGLRLEIWTSESELSIRLASRIQYTHPRGEVTLNPGQTTSLGPLLSLLGLSLISAAVFRTGSLSLCFTQGHTVLIDPDPQFEAWEAQGTGIAKRFRYLCGPGGGSPWG